MPPLCCRWLFSLSLPRLFGSPPASAIPLRGEGVLPDAQRNVARRPAQPHLHIVNWAIVHRESRAAITSRIHARYEMNTLQNLVRYRDPSAESVVLPHQIPSRSGIRPVIHRRPQTPGAKAGVSVTAPNLGRFR